MSRSTTCIVIVFCWLGILHSVSSQRNIFCYYSSWATYRPGYGQFDVEHINPHLCTHIAYAFFGLYENGTIAILDPWLDLEDNWGRANIQKFNQLKLQNPRLKTLAAIGGFNEGSKIFSQVAASADLRQRFAVDCRDFCLRHGFDGVDIDWEFPGWHGGDPVNDRGNFVLMLASLRQVLQTAGLMLTAAVAAPAYVADVAYDIPAISPLLDQINVMTYDFNGAWDDVTGHNAPLFAGPADATDFQRTLNVHHSMMYWLREGAPAGKLNLGIPFYGRTFTLANANNRGLRAGAVGPGHEGPFTLEPGHLGYNEICPMTTNNRWLSYWDDDQKITFAVLGYDWIGYDDSEAVRLKCNYIQQHNLAGGMIWAIDNDDFRGHCGVKHRLIQTLHGCLN